MKALVIGSLFLITCSLACAQTGSEPPESNSFKDRIFIGGGLGLQFGTITNIEVSPLIGYRLTDNFSAGLGASYIYFKRKFDNYDDFETSIYGYRLFARRNIGQQFFAQVEYENLSLEFFDPFDGSTGRQWIPGFFIGGGIFQPIGNRAGLNLSAMYNLMHDDVRSPYNSPLVLRIGITAGF